MVMYLGHVVEMGHNRQGFAPPYHPYTEALLSAVPIADTSSIEKAADRAGRRHPISDEPATGLSVPDALRLEIGRAGGLCEKEVPPMRTLSNGHQIKCHLAQDVLDRMEPVIKVSEDT